MLKENWRWVNKNSIQLTKTNVVISIHKTMPSLEIQFIIIPQTEAEMHITQSHQGRSCQSWERETQDLPSPNLVLKPPDHSSPSTGLSISCEMQKSQVCALFAFFKRLKSMKYIKCFSFWFGIPTLLSIWAPFVLAA